MVTKAGTILQMLTWNCDEIPNQVKFVMNL
jgi:hypothetical protein